MTEVESLRASAEEVAKLAGQVLVERFSLTRTIEWKGGIDLVTDADKASERVVLDFLRARYPTHAVLAEESGVTQGADVRWLVDPLDGTTNYAHRIPHFCVSIAAERAGTVLAGAVFDPIRNELFSAGRGLGAALNGAPLTTSATTALGNGLLCTGFPYDVRERPGPSVGLFTRIITQAQGVRRMGSAALDLAYVASGRYDGFWEFGLKPWDVGAGALLVMEAGGVLTCIDGSPYHPMAGDVLASCRGLGPTLQREVSGFLKEIGYSS